jgi:hypothetical protein
MQIRIYRKKYIHGSVTSKKIFLKTRRKKHNAARDTVPLYLLGLGSLNAAEIRIPVSNI